MTKRLYYTDAYLWAFEARITEAGEGGRRIYLDATAFYPTSGGQPHDTGTLDGVPVVDVIDEGERIAHLLAEPLGVPVGATVAGSIDRDRRFDHMQQHTGQHLLSAVFADLFGLATVSVHFGAEASTLDLDTEALERDRIVAAEHRANALVREDRPVVVSFEDADVASGLRKPSARGGTLRIVTIDGIDRSPCGGTHVRSTAQTGPILLRRVEKIRRQIRVEFLCGDRALRRARADHDALARAALAFSAQPDDVPALVEALREQVRELQAGGRRLEEELARYRARELYEAATPDAMGLRRILLRRPTGRLDELRTLAQALTSLPRAVIVGAVDDPPALLLAASDDSGVDAGATLRGALTAAGGRGGGSPRIAQGSVPDRPALERAIASLLT